MAAAGWLAVLVSSLIPAARGPLLAQREYRPIKPAYDDGNVEALPVRDNVHLVAGSGANVVVQVAPDGLLVVDTSVAAMSEKVLAAIKTIADKPIRQIINTSADEHHTSGNENLSNAGRNLNAGIGGPNGREPARLEGAPVIAHELVLHRMSGLKGEAARMPFGVWPHDTFFTNRKQIYFADEVVEMLHMPAAHTDGDLIVWFRKSDVISTGDVFSTVTYPMIDLGRGGSVQGILTPSTDPRHRLPRVQQSGRHAGGPGHGRICNESVVAEYRDMTTIIRDRIQSMIDKANDAGADQSRRSKQGLRRRVFDSGVDRRDVRRGDLHRPDARAASLIGIERPLEESHDIAPVSFSCFSHCSCSRHPRAPHS
jgi:glyoxylase-like metal-dependent hydrolase (beta-lactamase superfamily II)